MLTITENDLYCFSDSFIDEIKKSQLRLRKNPHSYSGETALRKAGPGFDFLGYKEYEPGDDLRFLEIHKLQFIPTRNENIPANLFDESNKLYIRQFEATSRDTLVILVDLSSSMYFSNQGEAVYKAIYALNLAGAMSLICSLEGTNCYIGILGSVNGNDTGQEMSWSNVINREVDYFNVLKSFFYSHVVGERKIGQKVLHAHAFSREIPPFIPRQNLVLISDCWFPWEDELAPMLNELSDKFKDFYLFQTLANEEIRPSHKSEKIIGVMDSENGTQTPFLIDANSNAYNESVELHCNHIRKLADKNRIFYRLTGGDDLFGISSNYNEQTKLILSDIARIRLNYL